MAGLRQSSDIIVHSFTVIQTRIITFSGVTGDLCQREMRSRAGVSCYGSSFRAPRKCALVKMNGARDGTHTHLGCFYFPS